MTDEWRSLTHRFAIGGHHGYIIVATDEHDRPLLLEIRMAKAGGVLRGLLDALATSVSLGLQKGVPLASYVDQLQFARFEPSGWTDSELGYAHSIVDYIARWLGLRFPGRRSDRPARGSHPGRDVRGLRRRRNLGGRRALPRVRKHWTVRISPSRL